MNSIGANLGGLQWRFRAIGVMLASSDIDIEISEDT